MSPPDPSNLKAYKDELITQAKRGGALVSGVADATAFHMAPEGHRPTDLLPGAKAVFVVGGAQPRAADWHSPRAEHMETTSTSDRISALALKLAHHIERSFGYYALLNPPGVDRGQQPFMSLALAAELAGCGTRSLAGPVLNADYGFMYYSALITTLPLPVDGPTQRVACPAPECAAMWESENTTPCLSVCPIDDGGCLGGTLVDGKIVDSRFDRARCTIRTNGNWVPGFQKALGVALDEPNSDRRKMILNSTMFTRTLWSMTYSNVSQAQCFECMRVCPVGAQHREKN